MMRNFFSRLGNSMAGFMQGRYGTDKLNMVMLITAVVLDLLSMLINVPVVRVLFSIISSVLLIFSIYRTFSRNIVMRREELAAFDRLLRRIKTLRTHHIYRCPNCSQKIRVPRKHGVKVEIRCPKCGQTFTKKI